MMRRRGNLPRTARDEVAFLVVGWYMVAGALFGGMYECALLAAIALNGLVSEAWQWWAACLPVAAAGASLGWVLFRRITVRPPLRLTSGVLAAFALPGLALLPFSLIALLWGVLLGLMYGMVVGLVSAILVVAVVRTRFFRAYDPRRGRRALVAANLLGILVIPCLWVAWWVNSTLRLDPAAQSSTSSTLLSLFVFAIGPTLVLLPIAEHVGNRMTDSTASAVDEKSEAPMPREASWRTRKGDRTSPDQ